MYVLASNTPAMMRVASPRCTPELSNAVLVYADSACASRVRTAAAYCCNSCCCLLRSPFTTPASLTYTQTHSQAKLTLSAWPTEWAIRIPLLPQSQRTPQTELM